MLSNEDMRLILVCSHHLHTRTSHTSL